MIDAPPIQDGELHAEQPIFGKLMEAVMHDHRITDGAKVQYAHMHWRYGMNRRNFEGLKSMAELLGVSERTISARIRELETYDWIVVIERDYNAKTGKYQTPFYHIFETPQAAQKFRKTCKPVEGENLRDKKAIEPRKTRKGKGGKPSHQQNSSSVGDQQNSSSAVPQNSSSDYLDALYLDSEGKEETPPAEVKTLVPETPLTPVLEQHLDDALNTPYKKLHRVSFGPKEQYADKRYIDNGDMGQAFQAECNALFDEWLKVTDEQNKLPAALEDDLWVEEREAIKGLAVYRATPADLRGVLEAMYEKDFMARTPAFWRTGVPYLRVSVAAKYLQAWKAQKPAAPTKKTKYFTGFDPETGEVITTELEVAP